MKLIKTVRGWHVLLLIVLTLSLVDGSLRIRIGAGWQISTIMTIFLLMHVFTKGIVKRHKVNTFVFALVSGLIIISSAIGFLSYSDSIKISTLIASQVSSIEERMFVEMIRLISGIAIFFLITIYIDSKEKLLEISKYFIYGSLLQAFYALYEFSVKFTGMVGYLPLFRGGDEHVANLPRAFGTFYEPSQLGLFIVVSVFVYMWYLSSLKVVHMNNNTQTLYKRRYLFMFILALALLASLSRAGLIVFIASYSIYILLNIERLFKKPTYILMAIFFSWIFYELAIVLYGENYFISWWNLVYHADKDTGNSIASRLNGLPTYFQIVTKVLLSSPFGSGVGNLMFTYSMVPFFFRIIGELGIFITVLYFSALTYMLVKIKTFRHSRSELFILFISIILTQLNYNTIGHQWIWFVMSLIFVSKCINTKSSKERIERS